MRMIERIVEYATVGETRPTGLKLFRITAGREVMRKLRDEVLELTGVDVGPGVPDRITYRGVRVDYDEHQGDLRLDAEWRSFLTAPGGPLAQ